MKTICILGSTGTIGQELVSYFSSNKVIAASRSIKDKENQIHVDLSNSRSVCDFIKKINSVKLDYLFLNSGVYRKEECREDGFECNFLVNAFSPYFIAKKILLSQPNCKIIFTSSISILHARQNASPKKWKNIYRNTKLIGHMLLRDLKQTYPNSICFAHPGIVPSRLSFELHGKFVQFLIRGFGNTPLKGANCLIKASAISMDKDSWVSPCGVLGLRGKPKVKRIHTSLDVSHDVWNIVRKIEKEFEKYGI